MRRTVIAPIVFALSLFAAQARADLVCEDAVSQDGAGANYRFDEIPPTSSALFLDLRNAACGIPWWEAAGPTFGPCAASCLTSDEFNDWVCMIESGVDGDIVTQAMADDCAACVASLCADERDACMADGS